MITHLGGTRLRVIDVKTPLFWFLVFYERRRLSARLSIYSRRSELFNEPSFRWWIHIWCWEVGDWE